MCRISATRWTHPAAPSSIAPCPVHASVASATAPPAATPASDRPPPLDASAADRAMPSATIRTIHVVPVADPVSSRAIVARSTGHGAVPAIAAASSAIATIDNASAASARPASQRRHATARPLATPRSAWRPNADRPNRPLSVA
uniref:hypothetical protein n=1 Tax=Sphingomonas panni TaxID=237612 RepID=UPI003703A5A3